MRKKRIMTVCHENLVRSKILERYLSKNKNLVVDSCGVGFLSYFFGKHFNSNMKDFDLFFASDTNIYDVLARYGVPKKKIINLHIPNVYSYFLPFRVLWFHPARELERRLPRIMRMYGF